MEDLVNMRIVHNPMVEMADLGQASWPVAQDMQSEVISKVTGYGQQNSAAGYAAFCSSQLGDSKSAGRDSCSY